MAFACIEDNDVVIFWLSGKIPSCEDAKPIREKIKEYIAAGRRKFVFDLGEVPWINSDGVGLIAMSVTPVRNVEGKIVLTGIGEKVKKVLEITGCDNAVGQFRTREEAVQSILD